MELQERFLRARRNVIAADFSKLNDMQRSAVLATEGPLLLLAGAGSGKTTVLINRIANLIRYGAGSDSQEIPSYLTEEDTAFLEQYAAAPTEEGRTRARSLCQLHPAAPWNIIAITFTNKAANELKDRLTAMLGPDGEGVWAMTFHSACCRILRRDIDRLGYDRHFTIYDTDDSTRVIKDILKEQNLDDKVYPPRLVLSIIGRAKDAMQSPEEFAADPANTHDFRYMQIAKIYAAYQTKLKEADAVDFDDIILLTVKLLQQNPDVLDYYQEKFRYVLIDEYQDTNHLQYLLASLLAGKHQNICVVGDDDQSIYRFRGATIENILNFEEQYKKARVIRLEQNYRSTKSILRAANAVISNNRGRKGKQLWTDNDTGDQITVYEAFNESDEADFVSNRIFSLTRGKNFKDVAILYRTNAQSNALEYSFKRNGIPYRVIGGMRFFDRAEVKDMIAYLCLINNRSDDLRLMRIINTPARGIGAKTVEMAQRQAEAAGIPLYQVISHAMSYPCLEKAAPRLMAFTQMIESCAALLETMSLPEFYDEVLRRTGYLDMLQLKDDVESRTRAENVQELKSSIVSYLEHTDTPTLSGFLEEVALYTDIEQYDENADAAVMMTIHSAKGLEFPYVFLVGWEEGLFPSSRSMDPAELEEERRLCYVAITRAKQNLAISYAKQRMLYGHTNFNRPSRFLSELPGDCITGFTKPKPVSSVASASAAPRSATTGGFSRPAVKGGGRAAAHPSALSKASVSKSAPKLSLTKGDMVRHRAFGKGMVLSVLPMGNDALLEIAFDEIGTKKLMANAASQHMSKL